MTLSVNDDILFHMEKACIFLIALCFLFFSCASDTVSEDIPEEIPPVIEETVPVVQPAEPVVQPLIEEEPEIISVAEPVPEPEPEPVPALPPKEVSDEYLRSISNLSGEDLVIVPPEVFEEDKNQIFQVINELDRIMKKKDFDAWLGYLTPESAEYWSNRHNLLELSRHLFSSDENHINNIREYFELFFIPARRGRLVDEIRYVTPDLVKVVQYKNKTDIIYYFFEKQNNVWLLRLDTL